MKESERIIYHIYPLGFCGVLYGNDFKSEPRHEIKKINSEWIEHIKNAGFNTVYFGPLFESVYHGYDTADYYTIDRRLGTDNDFKDLVRRFHDYGIEVIVDGVFNHVGTDFWAFCDVVKKGKDSEYVNWFFTDFEKESINDFPFYYEGWEGDHTLVKLNLSDENLFNHLSGAVKKWIEYFNIDGIRFDVAYALDRNFIRKISQYCRNIKPDIWLLGEMIHGDYNEIVNPGMFNSSTNYEVYKGIYSSHNDGNYFEIEYALGRQYGNEGIYKNLLLYNFTDNHDVSRIASVLKNPAHLYPVYIMLFTIPGIPSVYYGSEWGISGKKEDGDECLRPEINIENIKTENPDLIKTVKKLSEIRKNSAALKNGKYSRILVKNEQFVFMRENPEEKYIIALNMSGETWVSFTEISAGNYLEDILNNEKIYPQNGYYNLKLYSSWGRIMKIKRNN